MKSYYATAILVALSLLLLPPLKAQDAMRVENIPQTDIVSLAMEDGILYAASYGHIYRSYDGGATWDQAAALPPGTSDLNTLLVHEDVLYAGTIGSGVFASQDKGASWLPYSTGLAGNALRITVFAVRGDSLYAGTDGAGIHVLNLQNPTGWQSFNQGFPAQGVGALTVSGNTLVASGGLSGSVYVRPQQATNWTTVPLDAQDPQNQILDFLPEGPYLLAGTAKGIYRSANQGASWFSMATSLPASSDVVALTTYGARIYAGIQQQGFFIYSSDDYGLTWTLRRQEPMPIYDLLGSHDRLWIGRADGLWYYDLASSPRLFQASLMDTIQGQPAKKGSVFATLEGNDLRLVGFFRGLTAPWIQMDLYRGNPGAGGEVVRNIGISVPEGGGHSGGVEVIVPLTDAQVQDLLDSQLYFVIHTLGNQNLSGQIRVLPLEAPRLLETSLSYLWRGEFSRRGTVLATLERDALRLIGFGFFATPVGQVALYRGALGEPGEHLTTLWANFIGSPETSVGFDHTLTLSEALQQDLLDGLLHLEVLTFGLDKAQGRLFPSSNQAPAASQITAPTDGTTITIGGTGGADPVDPETPLAEITFSSASDPEGSPVAYIWQLSRGPDFLAGSTVALDLGPDSTTIPLTVATAAALFDDTWTGFPSLPLHTPIMFYHRVITTDGARYTYGPTATVILTRGTITANEPAEDLPERFVLHGNYPNPFNPTTTISFDLPAAAEVHVEVFNLLGQHVLTVPAGTMMAGAARTVSIDGAALSSGSYLYRVIVQGERSTQVATGRMVLIK